MDTQQFEIIRPKCAGLNVYKKSVVAAVCTSDPVTLTASYKTKVFNTTNSDIAALATGSSHRTAAMPAWNPREYSAYSKSSANRRKALI